LCNVNSRRRKIKVLVIGANGQLGSDIVKVFSSENVIPLTHKDVEISEGASVKNALEAYKPDLVINTAAYHRISDCEKNALKSFGINSIGTKNLAIACRENKAILVHISTDYVFDGEKKEPYIESDSPRPLNVYGISKLAGEYYIKYLCPKYFIVRTSGLYGSVKCRAKGGNFIDLMLNLAKKQDEIEVVNDEVLTPTYTLDLARKIRDLIQTDYFGLYHITNNGSCSWYEFAEKIFEFYNLKVNLKAVSAERFASEIKRPRYSVLRNYALEKMGMDDMRKWDEALEVFLSRRGEQ